MTIGHEPHPKVAVLIDAENISPRVAQQLFERVAIIGEASVRRIYGDFSGSHLKGWTDLLAKYAIVAHQSFTNTPGKNASDIALVIDAMDLLHSGRLDAFCLVSSDGDFTKLAARIREQGVDVYGFGTAKAPDSLRNACKHFSVLGDCEMQVEAPKPPVVKPAPQPAVKSPTPSATPAASPCAVLRPLRTALDLAAQSEGWYALGEVGLRLKTVKPDFTPKSYGCSGLLKLVESTKAFEIRREELTVFIKPIQSAAVRT